MLNLIDVPQKKLFTSQALAFIAQLKQKYDALSAIEQKKRSRDLAHLLGVTEAQWVASSLGALQSIRLEGDGREVFKALGSLGSVMALTRNQSCVHERQGEYLNIQAQGPVGLVLGSDIDLRIFFTRWAHVWAVQDHGRLSLQFFDQAGVAIHKVFCTEETNTSAYLALVQRFAAAPDWPVAQEMPKRVRQARAADRVALRQAWLGLKDTHDFFTMLQQFDVERLGALSDVGSDLAQQISVDRIDTMLRAAAQAQMAIMCFVSNPGMIQIHSGVVEKIVQQGPWLNVLDHKFNLHLNLDRIQNVWVVNKPTIDGWVTSIEVFDDAGEMIVQFFGARKPGVPEQSAWRELLVSLCSELTA
jgi:putative hemin transport protein